MGELEGELRRRWRGSDGFEAEGGLGEGRDAGRTGVFLALSNAPAAARTARPSVRDSVMVRERCS